MYLLNKIKHNVHYIKVRNIDPFYSIDKENDKDNKLQVATRQVY